MSVMQNGEWDPDLLGILSPQGDYLLVNPANDLIGYAGWQWLNKDALASLIEVAKRFKAKTGRALYVREAFRSRDTQDYYVEHPPTPGAVVAVPGTSIHGWGLAVDVWSGIDEGFNSEMHLAFKAIAEPLGWKNTGTNFNEPWHWEFSSDSIDPAEAGGYTELPQEDELPSVTEVTDAIFNDPRFATIVNRETAKVINGSAFNTAVKGAVDDQLAPSLSNALNTVVVPFDNGTSTPGSTNLRNWFKDVRNRIMSLPRS